MKARLMSITWCLVVLAYTGSCGGTWPRDGGVGPPLPKIYASAHIAPGAPAELPTTLRIAVFVIDSLVPVASISVDPDGTGGVPPEQVKAFTQFEKRGVYTGYFLDYEWEGPDGTEGLVLVTSAGGTLTGYTLYLTLERLSPWLY